MPRSTSYDPITGSVRQPLWRMIIAVPIFYGALSYLIASFPQKILIWQNLGFILAILSGGLTFWMNYRPSQIAKSLVFTSLASMFMLISIRSFSFLFPNSKVVWILLIVLSFVMTYLPQLFQQPSLLKSEFFQKGNYYLPFILPAIGLVGTIFGLITTRANMLHVQAVFLGLIAWLLGIALSFSLSPPQMDENDAD